LTKEKECEICNKTTICFSSAKKPVSQKIWSAFTKAGAPPQKKRIKEYKKARIEFQSEPFRFYIVGVKPQPTLSLSCER